MSKKILIADDEAHIRRVIELKLKTAGYDVQSVTGGKEALDAAHQSPPDAIICDYQMPPGALNGLDVLREFDDSEALKTIPFILLTGSVLVTQRLADQVSDPDHITLMSKPFSPRQLLKTIEKLLADDEGRQEHDV